MRFPLAPTLALLFCTGSFASPVLAQPPDSLAKQPLASLTATLIEGSGPTASNPDAPAPPVHAVRFDVPINVDGSLDEAAWQTAPPTTLFHQRDPVEWAAPSQRTEVRVGYDDAALYIGAHLYDTAPDSVIARLTRRDVSIAADQFFVYLDPNRDRRSGYYFGVNAAGTLYDGTLSNDGAQDNSWDAVWLGRARRTSDGWVVEMRIPFSQLRYAAGAAPEWGIDFQRIIQRRSETVMCVHQPKTGQGFCSRFPALVGLRDLHTSRTVELLPYVTSKGEFIGHPVGDPFNDGSRMTGDVGGDLRTSVGSRLTLNATVNPDFGQVEVDPAVVNLSDAETFFSEKRPFFVEGSSAFRFGNEGANSYWNFNWPEPTFFYSRRIGRGPEIGAPGDAQYTNVPLGTTILGAAKLTGKLGSSWNFGTLHALTNREEADILRGGLKSEAGVEPLTYYGIASGLHEFKDRRYGLGLLGSTVLRSLDAPQFASGLDRQAFVGGVDGWVFLDAKKMWVISGYSAMSHVRGTQEAILAMQRNPRHYFQRPDAGEVRLDSSATSLTGNVTRLWLNKQQGNWYSNAGFGFITPGLEMNDIGFSRSTDVINGHFALGRKWTKPNRIRKQQNLHGALFGSWDWDGVRTWGGGFLEGNTEFINNYSLDYEWAYNPQSQNDRATRGGPRMVNAPGTEFSLYFDTDSKRPLFYSLSAYSYTQPAAGNAYTWNVYPAVDIKPVPNLLVSVGPGYERSLDTSAYVETDADPLATATYGNRYLFADNHQTTLSANLRVNWSFSPRLSLQFFGQPYFTTAGYDNYKEFAKGGTYDFNTFGQSGASTVTHVKNETDDYYLLDPDGAGPATAIQVDNRSFNYRSMRGNAVLRWEYMPGSAFYLVWTQLRQDIDQTSDFSLRQSTRHVFDAHPDNIFLAKVTYYFAP